MTSGTRRPLNLSSLRESSLIRDLVRVHEDDEYDVHDSLRAIDFDLWSVTDGPFVVGRIKRGPRREQVYAALILSISPCRTWARAADGGIIPLHRRSLVPLEKRGL
jgi:hypothetical protein